MKFICVTFFCLPGLIFADAAIEMQEGSVKHWIEHYERERKFYRGDKSIEEFNRGDSNLDSHVSEGTK